MTKIFLKVNGTHAVASADGKLTSGMVGLPVTIDYDDSWDGLTKTAFFRVGNSVRKRDSVGTYTEVPWEILRTHGNVLEIGIEGKNENGSVVIPTTWAVVSKIQQGAQGDIPAAPKPGADQPSGGAGANIDDSQISSSTTWSSKNTVDKLCPSFTESGSAVTCEPVEGYPLGVTSIYSGDDAPGMLTMYHGGKNLIPKAEPRTLTENGTTFTLNKDGSVTVRGTPTANTSFVLSDYSSATHLAGKQVAIINTVDSPVYMYVHLHLADGTSTWTWLKGDEANQLTGVVPDNIEEMTVGIVALTEFDGKPVTIYPQLEFGEVATDYEPPKESKTYTVDLTNAPYEGGTNRYYWETGLLYNEEVGQWYQHDLETNEFNATGYFGNELDPNTAQKVREIPALPGANCLTSVTDKAENDCMTMVTGRADPVAIIEKLTNAILALGGNV